MANENWAVPCEIKLFLFDLNSQIMLPITTWSLKENHEVEKFKLVKNCGTTTTVSIGNDIELNLSMKYDKNDSVFKKIDEIRFKLGNTKRECNVFIIDNTITPAKSIKIPMMLDAIDFVTEENKVIQLDLKLSSIGTIVNLNTKDALEGKEVVIEQNAEASLPIDITSEEVEIA